jgi:3-oxoacyl-[acyl-carrier-protein] synthase II
MSERRVVITGLGVVSALGTGRDAFWKALSSGVCGISPVESFDVSGYHSRLGAEVKDLRPRETYTYALAAATEALGDAGVDLSRIDKTKAGVILGTTSGEVLSMEPIFADSGGSFEGVAARALAFSPGSIPAFVATRLGLGGPNLMLTTACAAGNFALAAAYEKIAAGGADLILAGGVDVFLDLTYAGFNRLLAVATDACRPFSLGRRGMVPGEGCAVLVVEPFEAARARGAAPYAELLGYGMSSDARHVTAPDADGVARAIASCLTNSGLTPDEVDCISAHGTGTAANDKTETAAIKKVFGARAGAIPVCAVKSMLGHAMGAASALQAAACCLTLKTGLVPPTINFIGGDPECDLDYVPERARRVDPRIVLSNAFAFGGSNCVVAFAKPLGKAFKSAEPRSLEIAITGIGTVESCADPVAAAAALPDKDTSYIDEPIAYALLGAVEVLRDAGLAEAFPRDNVGIILDSSGELDSLYRFHRDLTQQGPIGVEPRMFPNILPNAAASRTAILLGLKLVNESLAGSFPGGESALARAVEFLRRNRHGVILAGGVSKGASMLAVETLQDARARGARIYAQIEVRDESFEPQAASRRKASSCFCLAKALRKVASSGRPLDYRADGLWGGLIRMRLTPPSA